MEKVGLCCTFVIPERTLILCVCANFTAKSGMSLSFASKKREKFQ